ncbi:MAG TPA: DUF2399 domain-containing protein [Rhodococcus sp. (in: high G+C Gram-positive bacteria)]|nr:DUF2399 domain-containing protein [Rhodococcus sp. (in: high G+C Gram-positive bacteria)]
MSWSGSNELRAVLDRARRHVVSNGLQVTGKITVPVTAETPDLYRLALAMRRVKVDSTSTKVPIYVQSLDSWLQRPLNGGRSLLEVLDAESPLVDRPAERSAKNDAVDRAREQVHTVLAAPEHRQWLELIDAARVTAPDLLSGTVFDAVRILAVLPAEGESPVELSERVLGDTKALTDTPVRRWVLRLLAAAVGVDEPSTGAERAAVWEQFGVIDSGLASRVLTLGVRLEGHPAAATISGAAADAGVHQVWTLAQLRAWTATLAAGEVYVCENPTVVEAAERELGARCRPLLCTEGVPSEAVRQLLRTARGAVHWRGDFDWTGLRTTGRACTEFGALPWLMDAATYREALDRGDSEMLKSTDTRAESPWDPELAQALETSGRAVMEERLIPVLLEHLRR